MPPPNILELVLVVVELGSGVPVFLCLCVTDCSFLVACRGGGSMNMCIIIQHHASSKVELPMALASDLL